MISFEFLFSIIHSFDLFIASLNEFAFIAPFADHDLEVVNTTLALPGNGLPIDSHVLRPIINGEPIVIDLSLFKSPGKCQRSFLPSPIILFSFMATIQIKGNSE